MSLESAREVLLDHARRPRNIAQVQDTFGECRNPICGDHVRVALVTSGECIEACRIQVHGCTMCTASASMMSVWLKGRSLTAGQAMISHFESELLAASETPWTIAELAPFAHLRVNRMRIPCALIPWKALGNLLAQLASDPRIVFS